MSQLLQVSALQKNYGQHEVIKNISFELKKGTATALIGTNGAGKTTILSMLAGLLKPTSGQIQHEGIVGDPRAAIGFLPQYPQFNTWLTASEFLIMAAQLNGLPAKVAKDESEKLLQFVGLKDAANKKIGTFSGGMKQRLGLAQAIIHKPKLLLLDEPVSALDPAGRLDMMHLMKSLQKEMTILYSTHILNDAEQMTDQLLFLKDGHLVEQGSLQDVKAKYEHHQIVVEFKEKVEAARFVESSTLSAEQQGAVVTLQIATMQQVIQELAKGDFAIRKVEQQSASLEEIFMKVANG
ncbi:ABC transporter ATP-binding protein [Viridibacillus sp. YIM B01967]|uniref:ABC transporter ATP-binding protein n=1 Tax=Viridibacillus soli TaxID=2798301 RepID=A0ABS1H386_9BACL|nr:ABC transporter ATP-binding protein [Viridibacillus soli]MBK3493518.1 ABC transporter ATP-binding protein [Viridibacillus soli]